MSPVYTQTRPRLCGETQGAAATTSKVSGLWWVQRSWVRPHGANQMHQRVDLVPWLPPTGAHGHLWSLSYYSDWPSLAGLTMPHSNVNPKGLTRSFC